MRKIYQTFQAENIRWYGRGTARLASEITACKCEPLEGNCEEGKRKYKKSRHFSYSFGLSFFYEVFYFLPYSFLYPFFSFIILYCFFQISSLYLLFFPYPLPPFLSSSISFVQYLAAYNQCSFITRSVVTETWKYRWFEHSSTETFLGEVALRLN